ncbi:MAG: hypothetical protein Q4C58_00490 [Eubacteriales bacterium]|nr:hypothetical protein [Eubacteriales bacterium]
MSIAKKKLEDMDVMDDFLMGQLASDEEVGKDFCRRMLSSLLQKDIGKLKITAQKVLPAFSPHLRGIRMDVEVEEYEPAKDEEEPTTMNIYDVEPHLQANLDLPRHNRFYQARIDSRGLKSGEKDFSRLPNLYVLTILNFDPFGEDFMMYTVRNRCLEVPELEYRDGLYFYYFYTGGTKGGSSKLRTMLRYIQDSRKENATDEATRELHNYVSRVKVQPEVKQAYMRYEEIIYYERKEAAEEAARAATKNTKVQDILELLEEYGDVPAKVKSRLETEENPDTLKRWLKLAAKVDSIDAFVAEME